MLEKYNMPCHSMHPKQDYFRKDFYMHSRCTSILSKFYPCRKQVLHSRVASAEKPLYDVLVLADQNVVHLHRFSFSKENNKRKACLCVPSSL
jgi:hypothetical protein